MASSGLPGDTSVPCWARSNPHGVAGSPVCVERLEGGGIVEGGVQLGGGRPKVRLARLPRGEERSPGLGLWVVVRWFEPRPEWLRCTPHPTAILGSYRPGGQPLSTEPLRADVLVHGQVHGCMHVHVACAYAWIHMHGFVPVHVCMHAWREGAGMRAHTLPLHGTARPSRCDGPRSRGVLHLRRAHARGWADTTRRQ